MIGPFRISLRFAQCIKRGDLIAIFQICVGCSITTGAVPFILVSFFKVICELAKSTTTTDCTDSDGTKNDAVLRQQISDAAGSSHDKQENRGSVQCYSEEEYYDQECSECQIKRRDPTPNELMMCLHALSYKVRTQTVTFFEVR